MERHTPVLHPSMLRNTSHTDFTILQPLLASSAELHRRHTHTSYYGNAVSMVTAVLESQEHSHTLSGSKYRKPESEHVSKTT